MTLFCEADGATSYTWEKQSGRIPLHTIGVDTSTFTIVNLRPRAIDKYRCVATNGSGSDVSDYAELIINSKDAVYRHMHNCNSKSRLTVVICKAKKVQSEYHEIKTF